MQHGRRYFRILDGKRSAESAAALQVCEGNQFEAMHLAQKPERPIADMQPDDAGIWLLHCHINDHIAAGMQTRYQIVP